MAKPIYLTPEEQAAIDNPAFYEVSCFVAKRGGQPDRQVFIEREEAVKYKTSRPRHMLFVVGKNGMHVIRTLEDMKEK